MELWVFASIAAALFQTVRFLLHKVLSMGQLSTAGSTFARFAYASPLAICLAVFVLWHQGIDLPAINLRFVGYALMGGVAQILATVCVVALFRARNFAVGITFKKTEVIQTALVGLVVLGEALSVAGWFAVVIGLFGVLLLSKTPGLSQGFWRSLTSRATVLGLASGLLFAFSAVGYRGASLEIASDVALVRSATTLALVTTGQCLAMVLWLRVFEPGQITAVWRARKAAVWLGLTSMLGSLGWFTAFTLQTAAYVQALGQVELIFSILVSTLFFRETVSRRELLGMGVLGLSIVVLIFAI